MVTTVYKETFQKYSKLNIEIMVPCLFKISQLRTVLTTTGVSYFIFHLYIMVVSIHVLVLMCV